MESFLFDEVLEKYSYSVYLGENNKLFVDIDIKPEYRLEPEDDDETNYIEIDNMINLLREYLKPLIEKHIREYLKRWYKDI